MSKKLYNVKVTSYFVVRAGSDDEAERFAEENISVISSKYRVASSEAYEIADERHIPYGWDPRCHAIETDGENTESIENLLGTKDEDLRFCHPACILQRTRAPPSTRTAARQGVRSGLSAP